DDRVKNSAGATAVDRFARARVHEVVVLVRLYRFHERLVDGDRDVEVGQRHHVGLDVDELLDVGMVNVEVGHIGAAASAALLDGLGGRVEDLHKGHRAGRNAARGADDIAGGPEPAEGEAGAATALVDQCSLLDCLE